MNEFTTSLRIIPSGGNQDMADCRSGIGGNLSAPPKVIPSDIQFAGNFDHGSGSPKWTWLAWKSWLPTALTKCLAARIDTAVTPTNRLPFRLRVFEAAVLEF